MSMQQSFENMENPSSPQLPASIESASDEPLDGQGTLLVHPAVVQPRKKRFDRLQSFTRLVIGGIEVGLEQLWLRLEEWEDKANPPQPVTPAVGPAPGDLPVQPPSSLPQPDKTGLESARLAVIGLVFQTEDRMRLGAAQAGRAYRLIERQTTPLLEPLNRLPGAKSLQHGFNRLVVRGEMEVASWIKTGEEEEPQSRALAKMAWSDSTEDSIDFLATHPSVQELVQTQSTGLANEVIEEVRERTVSADTFLEGIARSILRKAPRAALPEPPPEVQSKATSLRSPQEIIRKKLQ